MNTKKRLIVLFDGTWNKSTGKTTNVYRLARCIEDFDGNVRQKFFYDPGVGTSVGSKIFGGLTGYGLSDNLLQGYAWLAENYSEGDEIWIFGFSRGAYTARSLAGLLKKCGLIHIHTPALLKQVKKLFRSKKLKSNSRECIDFRNFYSREPDIHFIGVWDTVGALGIPGTKLFSERGLFSWHDTKLSEKVRHAYHAVALDEHRTEYKACLWTQSVPGAQQSNTGKQTEQYDTSPKQVVEQMWFVGSHSNIGGGLGKDSLADITLQWMKEKASAAGLKLNNSIPLETDWRADVYDSFSEFIKFFDIPLYSLTKKIFSLSWLRKKEIRYFRPFTPESGIYINLNIHESVKNRIDHSELAYTPKTLDGHYPAPETGTSPESFGRKSSKKKNTKKKTPTE